MSTIKEHLLSINNFGEPKILTGNNSIATLLIRLILLEPGTYQSHPEMGVGLISKYRYYDQDKLDVLSEEIQKQITVYLPQFQYVKVNVVGINNQIQLNITIDGMTYGFETDFDNETITLSDLS